MSSAALAASNHSVRLFTKLLRAAAILLALSCATAARAGETADYVGAEACAGCHAGESEAWRHSHHAMSMRPATNKTVLGDFSGAQFEHFGVTTRFSRDGNKFIVRTDGPDGALHDYPVAYTFGVYPLQQYLIGFPDGRYQALGIAWDSRPKDAGGQRWFHLYPGQKLPPGDRLHWTGRDQTWNYQCAYCHSTDLQKNYDLTTNHYTTAFSDVDVACEACHGPASRHVAWAKARAARKPLQADMREGLLTWLRDSDRGTWRMNAQTGIAQRTAPPASSAVLDACGGCHARRAVIAAGETPASALLDHYQPALLEAGLYHPDGQIDGEVFEYGSFVQSRMFRAGVTCTNCHDPHAGGLRAQGNALCAQCHMPAKFDTASHSHHAPGSAGAQCVNCHMPAKIYMGVDQRRDHNFRVPRPDLTDKIGAPDSCTQCHAGKPAAWAADAVRAWYPNGRSTTPHYGTALYAGRMGTAGAEAKLEALIADATAPAIARASALVLLAPYGTPAAEAAVKLAIRDQDPLVRAAAPRALSAAPSDALVTVVATLVVDPVRAVRIEAARALTGISAAVLTGDQQASLHAALQELITAETLDSDRPEAHLNLGLLYARIGQMDDAEAQYRAALHLDSAFVPALVNLADLERERGMDLQGGELLRKALALEPANATIHHALGLLLVREHQYSEALPQLRQASELAPENPRYAYVYAIALNSTGESEQAVKVLERAHLLHPSDREVLVGLVSIARDRGDFSVALRHARELAVLDPGDQQIRALIQDLEQAQAH